MTHKHKDYNGYRPRQHNPEMHVYIHSFIHSLIDSFIVQRVGEQDPQKGTNSVTFADPTTTTGVTTGSTMNQMRTSKNGSIKESLGHKFYLDLLPANYPKHLNVISNYCILARKFQISQTLGQHYWPSLGPSITNATQAPLFLLFLSRSNNIPATFF